MYIRNTGCPQQEQALFQFHFPYKENYILYFKPFYYGCKIISYTDYENVKTCEADMLYYVIQD